MSITGFSKNKDPRSVLRILTKNHLRELHSANDEPLTSDT